MATTEERLKILRMIEDGKITAEDGAKLLAALSDTRRPASGASVASPGGAARWLRVRVTDSVTGKPKVNVNLPMSLVEVGLKIGARFSPELDAEQMAVIAEALKS
ncbi:MAG: hypothetical protein HZB20_13205, partial [Chloroflexi bacterium]|nr:hypothetical protein [Chloroflexota bacterium]